MNGMTARLALNIESPLVTTSASNFRPTTWPPSDDAPVVIDKNGEVLSRYGDPIWNLTPWANKPTVINFGDGQQRKGHPYISQANANILRLITAWWLWGPRSVVKASTLHTQHRVLRPIFILCTKEDIVASDLVRFPAVADKLLEVLQPSSAEFAFSLLHMLFAQRDQVGITLLDHEGLRRLEAAIPRHESRQTPYIPPRIWTYQINRLREFLEDFESHRQRIEDCFHFCLKAYTRNYGSMAAACSSKNIHLHPFAVRSERYKPDSNVTYLGKFSDVALTFEIDDLLRKWCLAPSRPFDDCTIRILSSYFTMVGRVSTAYLLNFSMMRISEAWSLRSNCLEVEVDDAFGAIYLLRGVTTKTVDDDNGRWIASPSVALAVNAASCVSRLRLIAGAGDPRVPINHEDVQNPFLVVRPYEPWGNAINANEELAVRPQYPSYQQVIADHPNLFDVEHLRVTVEDLQIAKLITPGLDTTSCGVGTIWGFSWHQLRRTGAVNMQASGIVSDSSIQYQLKHATRAMSIYYGQGYSQVALNNAARTEYIRTMYEILGLEISRLVSDRFVSPYGSERKHAILNFVSKSDSQKLAAAARAGRVSWRETQLGGCTRRGPCEFGGIDNIVRCGGGDGKQPCADALFDRDKVPKIKTLQQLVAARLKDAVEDSPYRDSLIAQQLAMENALSVLNSSK